MIDSKYVKLIKEFDLKRTKISNLDKDKKELREKIAELMHKDNISNKIVKINDDDWLCQYTNPSSKREVNHKLLQETVGFDIYQQIVTTKKSTPSLLIKLVPKRLKDVDKSRIRPDDSKDKDTIPSPSPIGQLM